MTDFKIDRPVKGEILATSRDVTPQIDGAEFLRRLDRVLELPGVAGVVWEQYTPYFNDGEPCVFTVWEPRIVFEAEISSTEEDDIFKYVDAGEHDGDGPLFDGDFQDYGSGYTAHELYKIRPGKSHRDVWSGGNRWDKNAVFNEEAVSFDSNIGLNLREHFFALEALGASEWESVAQENFGDHCTVVATKEGFRVTEYSHD